MVRVLSNVVPRSGNYFSLLLIRLSRGLSIRRIVTLGGRFKKFRISTFFSTVKFVLVGQWVFPDLLNFMEV